MSKEIIMLTCPQCGNKIELSGARLATDEDPPELSRTYEIPCRCGRLLPTDSVVWPVQPMPIEDRGIAL